MLNESVSAESAATPGASGGAFGDAAESSPAASNAGAGLIEPATSPAELRELTARLARTAAEADRLAEPSSQAIRAVHEAGLLTATVGSRYGGPDVSPTRFVDILTALGAGDPSIALISMMTLTQHLATAIDFEWPDGLYERVLRESAERPVLLNAARDEPRLGSFVRGGKLGSTVRRGGDGWILDGSKAFVTGAGVLDYHLLLVTEAETGRIGRAIVPGDSPGIESVNSWDSVGLRASNTHNVTYREVELPLGNFVPLSEDGGPGRAELDVLFMLGLSGLYLGVARSARDSLVKFLGERVPASLGAPLATVDRLQDATGEVTAQLLIGEEVLHAAAARFEADRDPADPLVQSAKMICTRSAVAAVELAVKAAGSHGISSTAPLERHLRDVLCARLHPVPDDVLLRRLGVASLAVEHWDRSPQR